MGVCHYSKPLVADGGDLIRDSIFDLVSEFLVEVHAFFSVFHEGTDDVEGVHGLFI